MQKNPSKLKTVLEGLLFLTWQSSPPNTVFLFGGRIYLWFYKKKSRQTVISHTFIGSASNVSGSVMTVTWKFFASINVSCLHFGQ